MRFKESRNLHNIKVQDEAEQQVLVEKSQQVNPEGLAKILSAGGSTKRQM